MSRQYRNTAQWLELIEAFEHSGQTQVEFCAELQLNPKYFSKRSGELLNAHSGPAFVQVQTQSMSTPAVNLGTLLIFNPLWLSNFYHKGLVRYYYLEVTGLIKSLSRHHLRESQPYLECCFLLHISSALHGSGPYG